MSTAVVRKDSFGETAHDTHLGFERRDAEALAEILGAKIVPCHNGLYAVEISTNAESGWLQIFKDGLAYHHYNTQNEPDWIGFGG